ncbi:hypothetical protein D9M69_559630 [compost metagenome]
MNAGGATAPRASKAIAASPSATSAVPVRLRGGAASASTGGDAAGACCCGIATVSGGGGQVTAPWCCTVAPRIISSSMLTTSWPSLPGVSSVSRWRILVA